MVDRRQDARRVFDENDAVETPAKNDGSDVTSNVETATERRRRRVEDVHGQKSPGPVTDHDGRMSVEVTLHSDATRQYPYFCRS